MGKGETEDENEAEDTFWDDTTQLKKAVSQEEIMEE
jgi:hypothetical protein